MTQMKPIPQDWIKKHIDILLDCAKRFPEGSPMRAAVLLRAEHIMDMVKAFRELNP